MRGTHYEPPTSEVSPRRSSETWRCQLVDEEVDGGVEDVAGNGQLEQGSVPPVVVGEA